MAKIDRNKAKLMARRAVAYFIDGAVITLLFQAILITGILPVKPESKIGFSILYFIGILLSCGYYVLFWTSSSKNTVGQFLCKLQIKHKVTPKGCVKRLVYLHLASFFYLGAVSYMNLRDLTGEVANSYMLITAIIVITLHVIYAVNIERIDKFSEIEVVMK